MHRMPAILVALLLTTVVWAPASEVQAHGLAFEQWLEDTFFGGNRPSSPTQKWDIPAEANRRFGGIPVNPKAAKYGSPVGMGDALRQFDVNEPFLLIIGYWRQEGDDKRFVQMVVRRVEPAEWRALWGPVTRSDLERLQAVVMDRSLSIGEARTRAKTIKNAAPFTEAVIQVNPKIDRSQRRLQCSLRFGDVFRHLAEGGSSEPLPEVKVFGVPVPKLFRSPARVFDAGPRRPETAAEEAGEP